MNMRVIKIIPALLIWILFFCPVLQALDIVAGLNFGKRWIDDDFMQDVYGHGYIFTPYIRYHYSNIMAIEFAYEGGYKRDGRIGLFQEDSTLSITGWELSGMLYYRIRSFVPYIKFGVGYYTYRQDIASEFVRYQVDHNEITYLMGGGLSFYLLSNNLFLNAEFKHVPLKVKPFDIEVDLSGIRFMVGIGYRFAL